MNEFDRGYIAQLRASAASAGLTRDDALALVDELERLALAVLEERALADRLARALLDEPFRGDRRDRMYGSSWRSTHEALDAWEHARGR